MCQGRSPSFNVAVTGSLIMFDREAKRRQKQKQKAFSCQAQNKSKVGSIYGEEKKRKKKNDCVNEINSYCSSGSSESRSTRRLSKKCRFPGRPRIDSIKPRQKRAFEKQKHDYQNAKRSDSTK